MNAHKQLLPFLDRLGYRCPTQFNPADFALELASVKIIKTPEFANAQSDEAKWPANHPFEESEVNNNVNGHMLIASNSAPRLVDACNQMLARTFETLEVNDRHKEMQGGKGAKASIFTLIRTNLWRSWMQQNRELSGLIVSTIMNALLGLVFGLLYYDEISRDSGRNTAGFLFSLVVTLLISSSIQVCLHFPMDFTILMREYYVGANTPVPYFLGRTIASIPYSLVSLLMGIIPYWMTGLARDAPSFGYFCLVLFFLIFGAQSIGYLASSFTSNPVVGLAILPLLITPMILFSGMLYERNTVRPTLKWMQDLSLINYSFALLVLNQVRRVHGPAQAFLMAFLQVQPSDWTTYLIELTCLAFGYRVLAMIVLMFKVRYFSQAH